MQRTTPDLEEDSTKSIKVQINYYFMYKFNFLFFFFICKFKNCHSMLCNWAHTISIITQSKFFVNLFTNITRILSNFYVFLFLWLSVPNIFKFCHPRSFLWCIISFLGPFFFFNFLFLFVLPMLLNLFLMLFFPSFSSFFFKFTFFKYILTWDPIKKILDLFFCLFFWFPPTCEIETHLLDCH